MYCRPITYHDASGVTIGRAKRAVHAGPALWGAQNLPDAVFKKFFWGKGGPFGILARGPTATLLRHCMTPRKYCINRHDW